MSELPQSVSGVDPSARARVTDAAAPAERLLPTTERTVRVIAPPRQAVHRATVDGPLGATELTNHGERLLIDRAEAEAEIDAGRTDRYGTRRPGGAPREARRLGILGC